MCFSKDFILNEQKSNSSIIKHDSDILDKIISLNTENIENFSSSMFYQIKDGYDVSVTFESKSTELHQNINLPLDEILSFETDFNLSGYGVFPENNIFISDIMIFRGVVVRQISFIPFSYNSNTLVYFHGTSLGLVVISLQ